MARGQAEERDGAIETDPGTLAALLTGRLLLDEALEGGGAEVEGGRRTAARFLRLFPMPEPCPAGDVAA